MQRLGYFTRRYFGFEIRRSVSRPFLARFGSNFGQRSAWLASWIATTKDSWKSGLILPALNLLNSFLSNKSSDLKCTQLDHEFNLYLLISHPGSPPKIEVSWDPSSLVAYSQCIDEIHLKSSTGFGGAEEKTLCTSNTLNAILCTVDKSDICDSSGEGGSHLWISATNKNHKDGKQVRLDNVNNLRNYRNLPVLWGSSIFQRWAWSETSADCDSRIAYLYLKGKAEIWKISKPSIDIFRFAILFQVLHAPALLELEPGGLSCASALISAEKLIEGTTSLSQSCQARQPVWKNEEGVSADVETLTRRRTVFKVNIFLL